MIKIKAICVTMEYDPPNVIHNTDLVGYVIQKYPRKVIKCSVLTRSAIESWYKDCVKNYEQARHTFLLGTVCVLGEATDINEVDRVVTTPYNGSPDPSAN